MKLSEQRKGELFITLEVLLWGFFPVITAITFGTLPALLSLAWSTVFAILFFAVVLTIKKKWQELLNIKLVKYVLVITLFNGILFYCLYFTALKYTTPGNASLISLLEILTSFLFFNVLLGEKISREYLLGACFMVIGALIVLAPNFSGINVGDFLILSTTVVAPVGNWFQQKARKIASSEAIIFLRSLFAAPIIFVLAYLFGQHASGSDVYASLAFLIINGALLLGLSKLLWVEGIHRISVTKAMAIQGGAPVITLLFAWLMLSQTPTGWQIFSLVPLILGAFLLTDQLKLSSKKST